MNTLFCLICRALTFVSVAFAGILLASSALAATNALSPRLVCAEPVYRFGTVSNQVAVEHTFLLRNDGSAAVHIGRVMASCGCVVPVLDRKDIPPGEQAGLRTTLSLTGRQGPQRRVVHVMSNDAVTPLLELWLEGTVACPAFEPDTVNFGTVLPTDMSARSARLVGLPAHVRLTNAVSDCAGFLATVAEDGRVVSVRVRPPLPDGLSHATVRAFTDSPATPAVSVLVTAMVVPAVRVMPAAIALPRDVPYASRTVWIRPGRAGTFVIREVRCPVDGVTPVLTNVGAGIYRLDLKNIPVSDALQGKSVTLVTSLADLPSIEIPFLFDSAAR